jgi:hypothetical protein
MDQSAKYALVVRFAGVVDLLIALFFVTTPFLSSRVGRPITIVIAAVLASGAAVMFVIANRRARGAGAGAPPNEEL